MSNEAVAVATAEDTTVLQCPVKLLPNFEGMLYLSAKTFRFVETKTGKKLTKPLSSYNSHMTTKDVLDGTYSLKIFFVPTAKKDAPPSTEVKLETKLFAFDSLPDRSMVSSFLSDYKLNSIEVPPALTTTANSIQSVEPTLALEEKRKRKYKDEQYEKLARAKVTLLARHEDIKVLYDKLVPDVVSDSEFWENKTRARLVQNEANKPDEQKRAVSWALQETSKDQNGVKQEKGGTGASGGGGEDGDSETITITPEYCQREFVRNPRAYEAYKANVPDKMTEDKFWTLYRREVKFQKEGKPEKVTLLANKSSTENEDKGGYHSTKLSSSIHPSIDLQSLLSDDPRYVASFPLTKSGEGSGSSSSSSILAAVQKDSEDKRKSKIVDKVNRLGELFQQEQQGYNDKERENNSSTGQIETKAAYIHELQEDIVLTELREEEQAKYNPLSISQNNLLQSKKGAVESKIVTLDTPHVQAQIDNWQGQNITSCLPSSGSAFQCIKTMSQNNRNMYRIHRGTTQGNQANQMIFNGKPHEIGDVFAFKLKQLSQKSFELFRHYWSCVPNGSVIPLTLPPQTEQKLARVTKCLEGVHDELESLRSDINADPKNAHLYELTRALDGSLSLIFGALKFRAEARSRTEVRTRPVV